jgi:hypothetical protein
MAFCFELVVNFGDNAPAAREAAVASPVGGPIHAGRHRIPLHRFLLNTTDYPYVQLSVLPVAVGFRVAMDGTLPRTSLSAAELTELGQGLYRLLATFDGYVAAKVGWDPEGWVDPEELSGGGREELAAGRVNGLVLSRALHDELGLRGNGDYVEFRPGYVWRPYLGEKPSWHTRRVDDRGSAG